MRPWGRMPSAIPRMRTQGPAPARTPTPRAQPTYTRLVPPSLHCSQQALACVQQQRKVPGRNHHYDQRRPENLISNSKHELMGRESVPRDSDVLWAWGAGAPTSQHPKSRHASQAGRHLLLPRLPADPENSQAPGSRQDGELRMDRVHPRKRPPGEMLSSSAGYLNFKYREHTRDHKHSHSGQAG